MRNLANSPRRAGIELLIAVALIGCGGGDATAPATAQLRVVSGANQTANMGSALPAPIVVQVQDPATGAGRAGVLLRPRLTGGGSVVPTEATTDANGQASFTWTLASSPGSQQMVVEDVTVTLRATVTATALAAGAVATVEVAPASTALGLGQTQQLTATLRDAQGAILTGRTVAWTSTNPSVASVSATGGLVTANAFGSATITATSETKTGFATVLVSNSPPTQLGLSTQPAGAVNGVAFAAQPVVEVRDAGGGIVVASNAQVTAAIQDGTGTLAGTLTVTASNGVAAFTNLSITGGGLFTLKFTSPGLTPITSVSFLVPLAPTSLRVVTQPAGATSGIAFTTQPSVEILDQTGARFTAATNQVIAARDLGTGTLSGTLGVAAVNGLATFTNLAITGSGTHSLAFSAAGVTGVSSQTFNVVGGGAVATSLAITTQPGGAVIGADFVTQPVVEIRDALGALVTTANAAVTATVVSTNGAGGLSGTTTVTAVNGIATFTNLRMNSGAGGAVMLGFSSSGLTSATSAGFLVSTPTAPALSSVRDPGQASDGANFGIQPIVHVLAVTGQIDATSTAPVTASIASGTGTLTGAATVNAVNGVATFTNLRIIGSGAHTLRYTSPGITSVTSGSFVVAATSSQYALDIGITTPASVQAGQNITIPVILDMANAAGGNVGAITFTVSWDASKFNFVSGTVNGASGFGLFDNTGNATSGGSVAVSGFATNGASTTRTLYTIVLNAKPGAANSGTLVSASVSIAADANGNNITITPRNLAVNITP